MGFLRTFWYWWTNRNADGSCRHQWIRYNPRTCIMVSPFEPFCRHCLLTAREDRIRHGTATHEDLFRAWKESLPTKVLLDALRQLRDSGKDKITLTLSNGVEAREVTIRRPDEAENRKAAEFAKRSMLRDLYR